MSDTQEQATNKLPIYLQPTEEPEKDSSLIKGLKAVFNEESIQDTSKNDTHVTNKKLMYSGQMFKPSVPERNGDGPATGLPTGMIVGEPSMSPTTDFVPPISTPGDGAPEGSEPTGSAASDGEDGAGG